MGRSYYQAYIGTNSVRGSKGIYGVHVDADTLEPEIAGTCQCYNSGSLALSGDGRKLYAAIEGMTFEGYADGGVAGFRTDQKGGIVRVSGQRKTPMPLPPESHGENLPSQETTCHWQYRVDAIPALLPEVLPGE